MVEITTILLVIILATLGISAVMVALLLYFHLKHKNEEDKTLPPSVPPHVRQRNFDDFVKKMVEKGELRDNDRVYTNFRRWLMSEVEYELWCCKQKKEAEENLESLPKVAI